MAVMSEIHHSKEVLAACEDRYFGLLGITPDFISRSVEQQNELNIAEDAMRKARVEYNRLLGQTHWDRK